MKRVVLLIVALAIFAQGCAGTAKIRRPTAGKAASEEVAEPQPALTVGEKLIFRAAWKGLSVGHGSATVEELTTFKGYEVYKVVIVARTNKVLSKLFKVEDTFTSYIDKNMLTSRRYEAIIREGRYKKDLVVDYDFEKNIAIYTNLKDGSVKTCPVEKNVHDPISAAYFFRTMPIKVGDKIKLTINLNEKNYEVIADIEKRVNINIAALGSFDAFLVRPYVRLHGKRQRRAKGWGYITTSAKRLCPYIAVKVLEIPWIGVVTATLEKVEYVAPVKD